MIRVEPSGRGQLFFLQITEYACPSFAREDPIFGGGQQEFLDVLAGGLAPGHFVSPSTCPP